MAVSGDDFGQICDQCDQTGNDNYYCNCCQRHYCDACWQIIPMHRQGRADAVLHEKTDYVLAKKIDDISRPVMTNEYQEQLQREDMLNSWFGVPRSEQHRLPVLSD